MFTSKHRSLSAERRDEVNEARFYFAVLIPVCLFASMVSMIAAAMSMSRTTEQNSFFSIWSKARAQANTIVPFIMMK